MYLLSICYFTGVHIGVQGDEVTHFSLDLDLTVLASELEIFDYHSAHWFCFFIWKIIANDPTCTGVSWAWIGGCQCQRHAVIAKQRLSYPICHSVYLKHILPRKRVWDFINSTICVNEDPEGAGNQYMTGFFHYDMMLLFVIFHGGQFVQCSSELVERPCGIVNA